MSRKGFSLIELLIVIVVIGILSSTMMFSSTEAVSSARASVIVSNLRNLKLAALAYYSENMGNDSDLTIANVKKYLGNDDNVTGYAFEKADGEGEDKSLYVSYVEDNLTLSISEKLAARAEAIGLYSDKKKTKYTAKEKTKVYMFVR